MIRQFFRTHVLPHFGGDRRYAQLTYVGAYKFPSAVQARFAEDWNELSAADRAEAFEGLRDYFAICAADPERRAGMPSRIVDEAWHTFILFTRDYTDFCQNAFGTYLHHAPSDTAGNDDDVRHTWRVACARENIPVKNPPRLPRLFNIDRRLAITGARYYALNETDADRTRQAMGANAIVTLAMAFGILDSWNDPIVSDMRAMASWHESGAVGGDAMAYADAGNMDGGGSGGGGGCSGGGS